MQDKSQTQAVPSGADAATESPNVTMATQIPKIMEKIPKLSDLLKSSRPSDLVVYNITNVLYPFFFMVTDILISSHKME